MKKFIFLTAAALFLAPPARAGEIIEGSVPGTINYQGRLERDNAPITGPVHLYFRLYNSPTARNTAGAPCGSPTQPCVWESPELTVQAVQGIFSAELAPGIGLFTAGQKLYLEVQVESDTLSPREPLSSITYALVAKKLEDGASVIVTTLTAGYQVLLATNTGASVGIGGSIESGTRLIVYGDIQMRNSGVLRFPDNSFMPSAGLGAYGAGITSPADAVIIADNDNNATGNILFGINNVVGAGEKMRISNAGDVGIGTLGPPMGKLDVNGSLYVGNQGIYNRTGGDVNIRGDLMVDGGKVTGMNSENISLGETNNEIVFFSNGAERARIHSNDYFGVGIAAPASMIHSGADIAADAGVRGGRVSIGDYSIWNNRLNEIMAESGYHLLLQQTNPYNVGIGTDTPREKLHVRGSVRSDYGIIAATGAFSGDVSVTGNFRALGNNKEVFLTSTTIYGSSKIYGDLLITGGIGSDAGMPAYIASTQTFSGRNTFLGQITVSSDIASYNRLGAGVVDFDFPGSKYLQVGDNKTAFAYDNALAYLVAGSSAEARIGFYRGTVSGTNPPLEMARLETLSGNPLPNLALVVNGQVKTLADSNYYRIQNSAVWISNSYASTPAIFVSSGDAIVGIGTTVSNPNWRLTVNGNIRVSSASDASAGIIFADGSKLTSGNLGALSVGNVSNNSDAVVQSDADQVSGGDVILRAGAVDGLILKSGGNIGIGTVNPTSKLNIRGGDLVLGTPVNPYSGDSVEDLVVGGNIAFDGELLQRSASQVRLSNLIVYGNVVLSTGTGTRTGIGNSTPGYRLDVTDDINASGSIRTGGTARISNTGTVGSGGANATWDGVIVNVNRGGTGIGIFTSGGMLYGNGTSNIGAMTRLTNGQLLIGDSAGAPTAAGLTGTSNQVVVTDGDGSITLSLPQNIHTGASPTFAGLTAGSLTGVIKGLSGVLSAMNGTANYNAYWSDANTIAAEQYTALARGGSNADLSAAAQGGLIYKGASALAATGALNGVLKANGSGAPSAMNGNTSTLARWSDANTIVAGIVTDDGTNAGVGVAPTGGIKLDVSGKLRTTTFQITSGGTLNYVLASDASGNASWVNPAAGGLGDGWVGNEITDAANATLTRSGSGTALLPWLIGLNLGNANTWTATQIFTSTISAVLSGTIGTNDYYRVLGGAAGSNAGYLELATADDGDEPIYVRQYTGAFGVLVRTATLLNASGNTSFPGTITAPTFSGALSGNAATATALAVDGGNCTLPNVALGVDASGAGQCAQPSNVTGNAANVTGMVAVGNGGTGQTTLTSNGVLLGNGTGAVQVTAAGAANTVLRGTGGAPTFGTIDSNYTSGVDSDASFTIIVSTQGTGTCRTMNVTNGMVTTISNTFSCY